MIMETGGDAYITPHRQNASLSADDSNPPPIVRSPNIECMKNINERRWADYADDEPLPEVIFGKEMKPNVMTKKLLEEFNSVDDENWRKGDYSWTTVKRKGKKNNKYM